MSGRRRITVLLLVAAALAIIAVTITTRRAKSRESDDMAGVVLRWDPDPRDQLPIAGAQIIADQGTSEESAATSDTSGLFRIRLHAGLRQGDAVTVHVRHQDYAPIELTVPASDRVVVIHMSPIHSESNISQAGPVTTISNVRVRYASKITSTVNVGSTVKSFEVVNTGNVPCMGTPPCSPDGRWKATVSGISLDAGDGNEFGNARVSCIAGPCPFTKIDADRFSAGGRRISVSVRNWSDTTTFLIEAEVFRTMATDTIRRFYPIIFGQAMNFTLPLDAQGPSIEADLNGADIVFPLGPELNLSWGNCSLIATADHTKRYHCELKPGYRFG